MASASTSPRRCSSARTWPTGRTSPTASPAPGASTRRSRSSSSRSCTTSTGRARARAALLLLAGLPGQVFLYQGEELGLEEVDVPDERRQDPVFLHSGGKEKGRDGCRVPLPWRKGEPNAGFSTAGPWLPMPEGWARYAVYVQAAVGGSTLAHFRRTLAERRRLARRLARRLQWLTAPADVLAYSRGPLTVACNFRNRPARLPAPGGLLLGSDPLVSVRHGVLTLPGNSAAWLL